MTWNNMICPQEIIAGSLRKCNLSEFKQKLHNQRKNPADLFIRPFLLNKYLIHQLDYYPRENWHRDGTLIYLPFAILGGNIANSVSNTLHTIYLQTWNMTSKNLLERLKSVRKKLTLAESVSNHSHCCEMLKFLSQLLVCLFDWTSYKIYTDLLSA